MANETIEVTISPEGEVVVEASGFKGKDCLAATKAIEEALGGQVASRKMKPEAHQQTVGAAVGRRS